LSTARLIELIANRRTNRTLLQGANWTEVPDLETALIDAAAEAREAVERFFGNLCEAVSFAPERSSNVRIKRPELIENCLVEPFERLKTVLQGARRIAEREGDDARNRELEGFAQRCSELCRSSKTILEQSQEGYVYWASAMPRPLESLGRVARVPRLSLHGAPIEVADPMKSALFDAIQPVVLTSATLTTGGSFEFLKERLGLTLYQEEAPGNGPAVDTLTLGSPFDYRENVLVYLAGDLPDPVNATHWEAGALRRCGELVKLSGGRAFVLCTSFKLVEQTARYLSETLPETVRVMRQGELPRGRLLAEFRQDVSSVLVGTTSFWQGVDVPGESLSCVIIMKLPFAVPDEPLVAARVEALKSRGRDAFLEYQVPRAVMMFRQGFGRLIRTNTDSGVVAVLDPRIAVKGYGRVFLESLPPARVTQDLAGVEAFWKNL
jgi:ATP-dependent DNA helicase DinG